MTTLDHTGLHAYRLKHPCSQREVAFAERWRKENQPPAWLNHGRGVLDHLLYMSQDQTRFTGESDEREKAVAATVIQWLGTNCGFSFLKEALRDSGFVVTEVQLRRTDHPLPAERSAFDAGAKAMRNAIIEAITRDRAWVDTRRIEAVPMPAFGSCR